MEFAADSSPFVFLRFNQPAGQRHKVLIRLLKGRNVSQHSDNKRLGAILWLQKRHAHASPHKRSILSEKSLVDLIAGALTGAQFTEKGRFGREILRVRELRATHLMQFGFGITKHRAKRRIPDLDFSRQRLQRHADRGLLKQLTKTIFTLRQSPRRKLILLDHG